MVAMMDGFQPSHTLVHVATINVDSDTVSGACEKVFHLLNVGDDPAFGTPNPQAVAYRAARNRSLSVGDVLIADGVAFAVAGSGFQPVRVNPEQIVVHASYGVTPLGAEPYAEDSTV